MSRIIWKGLGLLLVTAVSWLVLEAGNNRMTDSTFSRAYDVTLSFPTMNS
jgi:hypothetical protein